MPTGQKLVTWNEHEEVELFKAILAVHDVKIDYAAVAAAFRESNPLFGFTSIDLSTRSWSARCINHEKDGQDAQISLRQRRHQQARASHSERKCSCPSGKDA